VAETWPFDDADREDVPVTPEEDSRVLAAPFAPAVAEPEKAGFAASKSTPAMICAAGPSLPSLIPTAPYPAEMAARYSPVSPATVPLEDRWYSRRHFRCSCNCHRLLLMEAVTFVEPDADDFASPFPSTTPSDASDAS